MFTLLYLDKCTDLDIPEDSQSTNDYRATLGHKVTSTLQYISFGKFVEIDLLNQRLHLVTIIKYVR